MCAHHRALSIGPEKHSKEFIGNIGARSDTRLWCISNYTIVLSEPSPLDLTGHELIFKFLFYEQPCTVILDIR